MIHMRVGYAIDWDPGQPMAEYYFREVKPDLFHVSKFLESKEPVAVYILKRRTTNSYYCDCMRGERGERCRHMDLVEQWLEEGKQVPLVFHYKEYNNEKSLPQAAATTREATKLPEKCVNLRSDIRVHRSDKGNARSSRSQRKSASNHRPSRSRRTSREKQKGRGRNKGA